MIETELTRRAFGFATLAGGAQGARKPKPQGATVPSSTLRATVMQDGTTAGQNATVLVDGADTIVTANGVAGYVPQQDDRVLVQQVGAQVEIIQFLERSYVTAQSIRTAITGRRWEMQATPPGGGYLGRLAGYTGSAIEGAVTPANITAQSNGSAGAAERLQLILDAPRAVSGASAATLTLESGSAANTGVARISNVALLDVQATETDFSGVVRISGGNVAGAITTTNASGQVTLAHGLPYTPIYIGASNQGTGGTNHVVNCQGITSTQFVATVRLMSTGAVVASTAVDLRWFAIG